MKLIFRVLYALFLGTSALVQAAPMDYVGVETAINGGWNLIWCEGTCPGASSEQATEQFHSYDAVGGGAGIFSSDLSDGDTTENYAQAVAGFSGDIALPALHAFASAFSKSQDIVGDPPVPHTGILPEHGIYNFRSNASAQATQFYTYTGGIPASFTFDLTLDILENGTDGSSAYGTLNLYDSTWTPSWDVETDPEVRLGEFIVLSTGLESNLFGTSTVTLQPGQGFFVATTLNSGALSTSIDADLNLAITSGNPALLVPSGIPVPIPAAAYLMFSGLLGLLGLVKRSP